MNAKTPLNRPGYPEGETSFFFLTIFFRSTSIYFIPFYLEVIVEQLLMNYLFLILLYLYNRT